MRSGVLSLPAGDALLGRVIDGLGRPLDGLGPLNVHDEAPLRPPAMNPLERDPIVAPIGTGVRAIDGLLTCGRGQRVGLFGGSGIGKSTLLGMMARGTAADVVVLALVGERGREVRSFLEHDLGPGGLARAVVVVSTSDSPPLVRLRAAYGATALAEYFRDQGLNVLLDDGLGDALRDGAARGRPGGGRAADGQGLSAVRVRAACRACSSAPATCADAAASRPSTRCSSKATTPTSPLPTRCAASSTATSCSLAIWRPAITIRPSTSWQSISRTMPDVTGVEHRRHVGQVREWLATLRDTEDLVSVGAYVHGTTPRIDAALDRRESIAGYLCQPADMRVDFEDAIAGLMKL